MPQVFLYQKCIVKDNVGGLKGLLVVETTQSCSESEYLYCKAIPCDLNTVC